MRILHVNHSMTVGGAEVMIIELARQQAKAGHQVAICSMYGPGALDAKAAEFRLKVFPPQQQTLAAAKTSSLIAHLRENPVDILNSHWAVWLATALARCAYRHPSRPYLPWK